MSREWLAAVGVGLQSLGRGIQNVRKDQWNIKMAEDAAQLQKDMFDYQKQQDFWNAWERHNNTQTQMAQWEKTHGLAQDKYDFAKWSWDETQLQKNSQLLLDMQKFHAGQKFTEGQAADRRTHELALVDKRAEIDKAINETTFRRQMIGTRVGLDKIAIDQVGKLATTLMGTPGITEEATTKAVAAYLRQLDPIIDAARKRSIEAEMKELGGPSTGVASPTGITGPAQAFAGATTPPSNLGFDQQNEILKRIEHLDQTGKKNVLDGMLKAGEIDERMHKILLSRSTPFMGTSTGKAQEPLLRGAFPQ